MLHSPTVSYLFALILNPKPHSPSPIGDAFRQRLRMFPSLVNCCTIDWFREWPDEALRSVAYNFYADVDLDSGAAPAAAGTSGQGLLKGVIDSCVFIHQSVEQSSKRFFEELRRCTGSQKIEGISVRIWKYTHVCTDGL